MQPRYFKYLIYPYLTKNQSHKSSFLTIFMAKAVLKNYMPTSDNCHTDFIIRTTCITILFITKLKLFSLENSLETTELMLTLLLISSQKASPSYFLVMVCIRNRIYITWRSCRTFNDWYNWFIPYTPSVDWLFCMTKPR